MDTELISRTGTNPYPSLADARAAVQISDFTHHKKRDGIWALNKFAEAVGAALEEIPADPRLISGRLNDITPGSIGLSRGGLNNLRSLLLSAISLVKPTSPGRHLNRLSPEWHARLDLIESRSDRIAQSRIAHFCSARGIGPNAVSDNTFAEFRNHLFRSLRKGPDSIYAATVRAWRRTQDKVEGCSRITVIVPDRRKRWVLPWSFFSEPLYEDFQRWARRLSGLDDSDYGPMPVRRVTVEHRDWQIRKFATALVRMGRDPATLNSLRDLVEIDTFRAGLLSLLALQDSKRSVGLTDLAGSLKAIARHHVSVDEQCLERMRWFIRKRLDPKQHGLAKKNRDRLRQFDEPENFITLLQLPPKLMRLATKCKVPRRAALLAQMAVAIEILWFVSPRVSNLVNLDLKRNLYRPVRSKCLYIVIDADEVKNREPLEHALSEESTALIELYIRVFRPHLPGAAASTALFPSRKGGPRRKIAFGGQISRLIHAHTGLVVNPHLFRHLTSTAYLDENQNGGEVVRRRLGHRSMNTVQKYYLGQTSKPFRHFDNFLLRLRREAAAANKVRRGKNDE